jgi:hypothetical protein
MSTKYPGGFITKNYVAPTPLSASGIWTLDQQEQAQQAGIWPFGGPFTFIEDVFSTYLYTGTGASQTITNNIDLSTKGGLVWFKGRSGSGGTWNNALFDTVRGVSVALSSNLTNGNIGWSDSLSSFGASGFTVGADGAGVTNTSANNYVSWTFRKQPKFFDVVTYTGNGSTQNIAHNLGSVPACIITKRTDSTNNWFVYHRSLGNDKYLMLNSTSAQTNDVTIWNSTNPTSTQFSLGATTANSSGGTYLAYIFAHDAGGFGLTGTDNVISCGSWTGSTSSVDINLGYEPQWLLIRRTDDAADWFIFDVMRQMSYSNVAGLNPNAANAEALQGAGYFQPTPTGFTVRNGWSTSGSNWIYIAIRRGPMVVPTTGTSVFAPVTGNFSSPYTVTTNFPVDLTISSRTAGATRAVNDRLRGGTTTSYNFLNTASTSAESTGTSIGLGFQNNTAVIDNNWQTGGDALWWNFGRAPSFFDEVCYSGNGVAGRSVPHNLAAVPELMIVKGRNIARGWFVYSAALGGTKYLRVNTTDAAAVDSGPWNNTTQTSSSVFVLGADFDVNQTTYTYVNYLFATCAGVSKVGSYTGTGATQTINCGFTGGARFVLIKRTDSTGDWWVWDTARGMVSGTDFRIDLNAGSSQLNNNWVLTATTGFQIVTTDASVNASGGSYIFLAIA